MTHQEKQSPSEQRSRIYDGIPFDPGFFCEMLPGRVGALCPAPSNNTHVVYLHLTDGTTLDVCHVVKLAPLWIAVAAFRDVPSCDEMDIQFVPYSTIHRVAVTSRGTSERTIGFQPDRSSMALDDRSSAHFTS